MLPDDTKEFLSEIPIGAKHHLNTSAEQPLKEIPIPIVGSAYPFAQA